jgi:hypothetical protein
MVVRVQIILNELDVTFMLLFYLKQKRKGKTLVKCVMGQCKIVAI